MTSSNKLIVLDADGVLVNYHIGYAKAWARAFPDEEVEVKDADAYMAIDRYGLRRLDAHDRGKLRAAMDREFWETLPPISGALEGCEALRAAGYRLVCVSAVKDIYRQAREKNLRNIGFPLDAVYATPNKSANGISPKVAVLQKLNPIAFVDDYAPYMRGVSDHIHKALILREPNGSPNVGKALELAHSTHKDLFAFAGWWLDRCLAGPCD